MQTNALVRYIRDLPRPSRGAAPADQALLEQFAAHADEAAFAELVGRHGRLVLGVCRRVLRCEQDAEDAFQATFLVLARKASSIRQGKSLASWLYGVAWRSAARLRDRLAEQRRYERRLAPPQTTAPPDPSWREVQELMHEELARLPEAYRAPLVLCYLEGKTQCEAAQLLGWGKDVLRGRLDRGRERLRRRLARRGITVSAVLLTAAVSEGAPASAALLQAAAQLAVGSANAPVESVANAVCRGLLVSRLKATGLILMAAAALGAAAGLRAVPGPQDAQKQARIDTPPRAGQVMAAPQTDRGGDPLPAGALARLGTLRFRHDYDLRTLVFGPGDKTLISAAGDRTIRVWDVASGKVLASLTGHRARINALALSSDGKTLASAGDDRSVHLWDLAAGKELRRLEGHDGDVTRVAFAPDGRTLASAGADRTIRLWDVAAGREQRRLVGHHEVYSLGFAPDGKALACGGYDPARAGPSQLTVVQWEVTSGKELRRHDGYCSHVFAQGGKVLVTTSYEHLRVWDAAAGTAQRDLPAQGHKRDVVTGFGLGWQILNTPVVASPDGKMIAAATYEHSTEAWGARVVRLWDLETGKVLHALGHTSWGLDALAFSADGKTLAVSPGNGAIGLWDVATGKQRNASGHDAPVNHLAFTPDGKRIVSGSDDWTCRLWDAATGAELRRFNYTDRLTGVALSPDGRTLLTACGTTTNTINDSLFVRDVATARPHGKFRMETDKPGELHFASACAVAIAPDGKGFAFAAHDQKLRVWDTASLQEQRLFPLADTVYRLCYSPDGQTLAGSGPPGTVLLWDAVTGREVLRLQDHAPRELVQFTFSPDNRLFATADGHHVRVWEMASGRERPRLPVKAGFASFATFSPDSRWLATGGDPGPTLTLWDLTAGREALQLTGHEGGVRAAAFAPDGRRLATASYDTTVLVWDLAGRLKTKATELPAAGRDDLWACLADPNPAKSQRALSLLAGAGDRGVAFLRARLKPASCDAAQAARLKQLIADLDSNLFSTREKATEELGNLADLAEPLLRDVLQAAPSAESRRRVETLLASLKASHVPPERLRELRALEVLERVNTADARRLLERLAKGEPGARMTREARAALKRLN
jgi:RNA polymerase sigma factor (sigma-70 family)